MSIVFTAAGAREVKNLGWLLRHHGEVHNLVIAELDRGEAFLIAYLHGPRGWMRYEAHFASFTVACRWVNRPRFEGVTLIVCPAGMGSYATRAGCGFISPACMRELRASAGAVTSDLRARGSSL